MNTPVDTVQIENVVSSTEIGHELDLEELSANLANSSYKPDEFPGLVHSIHSMDVTALIFRSGNVVCTGASSMDTIYTATERVVDSLAKLGVPVRPDAEITIENIVTSASLGDSLNLSAIAIDFGLQAVEYEPEQFPGLVYRMDDPSVVVLLFGSGELVITGATITRDAVRAVEAVWDRLNSLDLVS